MLCVFTCARPTCADSQEMFLVLMCDMCLLVTCVFPCAKIWKCVAFTHGSLIVNILIINSF